MHLKLLIIVAKLFSLLLMKSTWENRFWFRIIFYSTSIICFNVYNFFWKYYPPDVKENHLINKQCYDPHAIHVNTLPFWPVHGMKFKFQQFCYNYHLLWYFALFYCYWILNLEYILLHAARASSCCDKIVGTNLIVSELLELLPFEFL